MFIASVGVGRPLHHAGFRVHGIDHRTNGLFKKRKNGMDEIRRRRREDDPASGIVVEGCQVGRVGWRVIRRRLHLHKAQKRTYRRLLGRMEVGWGAGSII